MEVVFDPTALQTAASSFDDIATKLKTNISDIHKNFNTVNANWQGDLKDSAATDQNNAEESIKKINTNLENMNKALAQLGVNAKNVKYGDNGK